MKAAVFPVVLRVALLLKGSVEVVSLCLIVVTETVGWQWIMNVTCYVLLYLQFKQRHIPRAVGRGVTTIVSALLRIPAP